MRIYVDKDKRRIMVEVQVTTGHFAKTTSLHEEELTFAEAYRQKLALDSALEELVEEVVNG